MDLFEAIEGRRSIRAFETRPVERALLERIVHAAGQAPSKFNVQPWHFHVATGATRERVGQVMALSTVHLQEYMDVLPPEALVRVERFFANLGDAPVAIAVTIPPSADEHAHVGNLVATGCAIENLMLAAYAEGIGCCNISFPSWVRQELFDALGIAGDCEIVSLVVLGYPAENPGPRGRRDDIATFLD